MGLITGLGRSYMPVRQLSLRATLLSLQSRVWELQPVSCSSWSPRDLEPMLHNKRSHHNAAAAAKSLQSCPTLCDLIDSSPSGSPVPGILQARTLEWAAISISYAWKWKVKSLSRVWRLVTPWAAAYQAPPSVGFSRQEYWSGLPLPSPPPQGETYKPQLPNRICFVAQSLQSTTCSLQPKKSLCSNEDPAQPKNKNKFKKWKESLGENLHDLEFGKGFLNMMSREQVNNSKIDNLELIFFYSLKNITKKVKRQPTDWNKILKIIYLLRF